MIGMFHFFQHSHCCVHFKLTTILLSYLSNVTEEKFVLRANTLYVWEYALQLWKNVIWLAKLGEARSIACLTGPDLGEARASVPQWFRRLWSQTSKNSPVFWAHPVSFIRASAAACPYQSHMPAKIVHKSHFFKEILDPPLFWAQVWCSSPSLKPLSP